ncbi:hypothetical protein, partial [Sphaerotilus sp.]|uniref:hypothetical protein n=1 Tax=Sphaerotilus sp. TaxID=2093942 RepID=UPI0025EC49BE
MAPAGTTGGHLDTDAAGTSSGLCSAFTHGGATSGPFGATGSTRLDTSTQATADHGAENTSASAEPFTGSRAA